MKKFIRDLKVIRNKRLNSFHYILQLHAPEKLPKLLPGQFVEVLVEDSKNTFLRRPFSIHDVDYEENTISLFIKRVGEGTNQLAYIDEGDFVNVVYPLGNSFSLPKKDNVLLVGGGCGVAPLLFLARYLNEKGFHPTILIGTRSKHDLLQIEEYEKYGKVLVSTEDGSFGEKGLVIKHSILKEEFAQIYTCGPEPMMKAVAHIAKSKNVPCEVSLENTMACGIGVCLCCVVQTKAGHKCVCTEGPVFNINDLTW